jgi:hypothetical protein
VAITSGSILDGPSEGSKTHIMFSEVAGEADLDSLEVKKMKRISIRPGCAFTFYFHGCSFVGAILIRG